MSYPGWPYKSLQLDDEVVLHNFQNQVNHIQRNIIPEDLPSDPDSIVSSSPSVGPNQDVTVNHTQ